MKQIHQLFDQSQSNLRDLMQTGLKELPRKYHDPQSIVLIEIQKHTNTSLEILRKKR